MNKIAEVLFAYSPKNDDELELTVGDKIEVIGVEEEGWWKGKLKGRIGVFPSNFVVVEPAPGASPSSIQQQHSATSNKLNSIFGSKLGSKSSLSSNSLNTINSTSNNSLNNNFTSSNSNNLTTTMSNSTNTQQADSVRTDSHQQNESYDESNNNSFSERRPKPIRGVGYGDIFAAGAKPRPSQSIESARPVGGNIVASERMAISLVGSTLQRPVPKKPPPPTPAGNNHDQSVQNGSINSTSDQAPALPPKPSNQSFSPLMQQRMMMQQQPSVLPLQRSQSREQARVIHAYEPSNDDELELKVNDIIDIIDKKSEDHGWWKGELNGKIGVFPDNFVQLITTQEQQIPSHSPASMINQSDWRSNRVGANTTTAATNSVFSPPQQQQTTAIEGRVKSVFSSTPKGFSKELESNLEKYNNNNNPASFLSLKRNKLPGQSTTTNDSSSMTVSHNAAMNMGFVSSTSRNESAISSATQNGHAASNPLEASSPTKLNHITANRAKGPSRRPPSNISSRRGQTTDEPYCTSPLKKESSIGVQSKEEQPPIVGLPVSDSINNRSEIMSAVTNETPGFHQIEHNKYSAASAGAVTGNSSLNVPNASNQNSNNVSPTAVRPNSISNASDNQQLFAGASSMAAPKTSQRTGQQAVGSDNGLVRSGQKTPSLATDSPPASTPSWMINLRKTNAEKKREPVVTATSIATISAGSQLVPNSISVATNVASGSLVTSSGAPDSLSNGQHTNDADHEQKQPSIASTKTAQQNVISSAQLTDSLAKYDNLFKQISNDVTSGFKELREDLDRLREDLKGMSDLKTALQSMNIELKACQSATENQRKYIKELVTNLADERKKIALMQVELDKNLK